MAAQTSSNCSSSSIIATVWADFLPFARSLATRNGSHVIGSWGSSQKLHHWLGEGSSAWTGLDLINNQKGWAVAGLGSTVNLCSKNLCSKEIIMLCISCIICSMENLEVFWLESSKGRPVLKFWSSNSRQTLRAGPILSMFFYSNWLWYAGGRML